MSRKENPQKLTQLSPRSHPRHLVGKRIAQKDAIKDITSDSQMNSYFPYRWPPASLTINIYFYLFLYLYITRTTINNGTPHLKSLKSQNRRAVLGRPAIKLLEGGGLCSNSVDSNRNAAKQGLHYLSTVLQNTLTKNRNCKRESCGVEISCKTQRSGSTKYAFIFKFITYFSFT